MPIELRFWREGANSRWEVREISAAKRVAQADMIQVMDDPER